MEIPGLFTKGLLSPSRFSGGHFQSQTRDEALLNTKPVSPPTWGDIHGDLVTFYWNIVGISTNRMGYHFMSFLMMTFYDQTGYVWKWAFPKYLKIRWNWVPNLQTKSNGNHVLDLTLSKCLEQILRRWKRNGECPSALVVPPLRQVWHCRCCGLFHGVLKCLPFLDLDCTWLLRSSPDLAVNAQTEPMAESMKLFGFWGSMYISTHNQSSGCWLKPPLFLVHHLDNIIQVDMYICLYLCIYIYIYIKIQSGRSPFF